MAEAQFDFAAVDAIDAESIGEPGKRTFRIRILRGDDSASLWLEKQQLDALGEAIPRLLDQLRSPDQHSDESATPIHYFPDDPTVEFKVSRLALGYAQQEDRLVLVARDLETDLEEDDEPDIDSPSDASDLPTFSCRFSRQQGQAFSTSCTEAVKGGRPICTLCHRPIDPEGHMCPRTNGHQKIALPEGEA